MAHPKEQVEVEDEYTIFRISRRDLCMIADLVRLWLDGYPDDPDDAPRVAIAEWFVEAVKTHFRKLALMKERCRD